ncbi:hypothetical protein IVB18_28355 [Bradyrhizobium sp. 186]|uniref:hypothetical protein n=1 Tax=Bradyrhizobium sp. 186 TaxID=2782654 RepID=UPI002001D650|nr:hypothetical protein [Bradyrhizobium sp. 186]UPK32201.1 hypothetical protein IVB18_28355 [Bradyrhizobium sp. 186]
MNAFSLDIGAFLRFGEFVCDLEKSERCTENTGFLGRFLKATFVPHATESLMPWRLPAARFRDAGGAMIRFDPTAQRQMATQDRNRQ